MNKKPIYLLIALLALLSCTRDPVAPEITPDADWETPSDETPVVQELTAIFPADTRTSYSNNPASVGNFAWEEGDEIAIMLEDRTIVKGTLTPTSDPKVARVTYPGGTRAYHAIYPYSQYLGAAPGNGWTFSGYETRGLNYPSSYDISDIVVGNGTGNNGRSYNTCHLPLYALNTDGNNQLFFEHFGDLLRVVCNDVPSGTSELYVSSGTSLSGDVGRLFSSAGDLQTGSGYVDLGSGKFVSFSLGTLSSETDGIVLNVPLCTMGSAYTGFKITAVDGTGSILRQTMLDWSNIASQSSPGNGYQRTVSLANTDGGIPYLEILFGGGTITTGNSTSINANDITTPKVLSSYYCSYFNNHYNGTYTGKGIVAYNISSNYPILNGYPDRIVLKTKATNNKICLKFNDAIISTPKKTPSKIVIQCSTSDNGNSIYLEYNNDSQSTGSLTSSGAIQSDGKYTWNIPSNYSSIESLCISAGSNTSGISIYSIRIYL